MKQATTINEMDNYFEDEIYANIIGKVKNIEDKEKYQLIIIEECIIDINNSNLDSNSKTLKFYSKGIKVFNNNPINSKIGNTISISGNLAKFQKATNPGQFDEYSYNKILKHDYKVYCDSIEIVNEEYSPYHDFLYKIKKKMFHVYETILPLKNSGVLSAMILGDKTSLDSNIKELYQTHGISHILAISGLHVSLIGMTFYKGLKRLGFRISLAVIVSIIFIYSYGVLTNFSVSTSRAVIMLFIALISNILGRTYDSLSAASLSALIILMDNPLQIYSTGFLLSYGAILGISLIYQPLSMGINIQNKALKAIVDSILVSLSVQIMTLPILLYFFFEISTYSILFNVLLIPFVSVIIILAILGGLVGLLNLQIASIFLAGTYYLLNFYEWILNIASNFPRHILIIGRPDLTIIITYYLVLFIYILINYWKPKKYSYYILFLLMVIFIPYPSNNLEAVFLDVGQGDGIYMEVNNFTYLIDGGSSDIKEVGKYRLIPFLKSKGINSLDYVFVSHFDHDHVSGIFELMEEMDRENPSGNILINNLILPKLTEGNTNSISKLLTQDDLYKRCITIAKDKGINIIFMKEGDFIKNGHLMISCLNPLEDYYYLDKNSSSLVLSVSYNNFDMLLCGDIEGNGENLLNNTLLERNDDFYNVLKVAHHGSKNSTYKEFLNIVNPSISIISCGKNNSYGHPHEELIDRLNAADSKIYTTIDGGAISVYSDGEYYKIESFINK